MPRYNKLKNKNYNECNGHNLLVKIGVIKDVVSFENINYNDESDDNKDSQSYSENGSKYDVYEIDSIS